MILALRVLGSSEEKKMSSGRAMAPILETTCCFSSSFRASLCGDAFFQGDEGGDALAFYFVRFADDGGFGYGGMIDQGAFDFVGGDAMAGDVHDVVHAAQQPEVAAGVHLAAVAGEIDAGKARPILLDVAVGSP